MKHKNSTIVSVSVTRTDPREAEARNLVMWLKTVPSGAINPCLATTFALHLGEMRAVDRLKSLVVKDLDIVAPGVAPDFLRVKMIDGTDGVPMYVVGYMEYVPANQTIAEDHFSSMCTQHYTHIVDAFKCLQKRIESPQPFKSVRV